MATIWSLDVDNILHPHLSLESYASANGQTRSPTATPTLPADNRSPSTTVTSDELHQRHPQFYFADDNVIFQVENTRYKIHRYFFQRDSEVFASIFALPSGPGQGASSENNAICLVGVTVRAFDLFLSILYPPKIGVYSASSVEEWIPILDLAVKWKFESIRDLAIQRLVDLASPIDKIVIGRKYDAAAGWLSGAYQEVCQRSNALTLDEANRLCMADVVKISSLRQDIRSGGRKRWEVDVSLDVILEGFDLYERAVNPEELTEQVNFYSDTGDPMDAEKPVEVTSRQGCAASSSSTPSSANDSDSSWGAAAAGMEMEKQAGDWDIAMGTSKNDDELAMKATEAKITEDDWGIPVQEPTKDDEWAMKATEAKITEDDWGIPVKEPTKDDEWAMKDTEAKITEDDGGIPVQEPTKDDEWAMKDTEAKITEDDWGILVNEPTKDDGCAMKDTEAKMEEKEDWAVPTKKLGKKKKQKKLRQVHSNCQPPGSVL